MWYESFLRFQLFLRKAAGPLNFIKNKFVHKHFQEIWLQLFQISILVNKSKHTYLLATFYFLVILDIFLYSFCYSKTSTWEKYLTTVTIFSLYQKWTLYLRCIAVQLNFFWINWGKCWWAFQGWSPIFASNIKLINLHKFT